jgi:hypothetical protein
MNMKSKPRGWHRLRNYMGRRKKHNKQRWMVNYVFQGGTGRVFLTTDIVPLSEELVRNMDDWLRNNVDVINPYVSHPIALETIYVEPIEGE